VAFEELDFPSATLGLWHQLVNERMPTQDMVTKYAGQKLQERLMAYSADVLSSPDF